MNRIAPLILAGLAYSAPAAASKILVYSDSPGNPVFVRDAAVSLGISVVMANDPAGFDQLFISDDWDVVVAELTQPTVDNRVVTVIGSAVAFGDPVIVSWAGLASHATMRSHLQLNTGLTLSNPVNQFTAPTRQWDFFQGIGGALVGATHNFEPNVVYVTLAAGGWIEADNGGTGNTIAVTRGGLAVTNAFAVLDYQGSNDGDGAIDMIEVYQEELDFLIPDPIVGPQLSISGACPGSIVISVTNNSPGRLIAYAKADFTGTTVLPRGSCTGLTIDLAKPVQYLGANRADNLGNFTLIQTVQASDCGDAMQVFDAYTCDLSDVVFIP